MNVEKKEGMEKGKTREGRREDRRDAKNRRKECRKEKREKEGGRIEKIQRTEKWMNRKNERGKKDDE